MMLQPKTAKTSSSAVIHVGNNDSWIEGDTPSKQLVEMLSYQDAAAATYLKTGLWGEALRKEIKSLERRMLVRRGEADGSELDRAVHSAKRLANTVCLYDVVGRKFPTTLLRTVLRVMRESGFRHEIVDEREPPEPSLHLTFDSSGLEDREYQERAVAVGLHCRAGIFAMATNSGKTAVMMRIMAKTGLRTLVIVQKQELLYQIADEIRRRLRYDPGLAGSGEFHLRPITVAIVNSAYQKVEAIARYGFEQVFVDEGHHGASRVHFAVLSKIRPYRVYAMTGTDFRTRSKENIILRAAFGGTIFRVDNQFMTEHGYSAKLQAEILPFVHSIDPTHTWGTVYREGIAECDARNRLVAEAAVRHANAGETVLVLTDHEAQGSRIHAILVGMGARSRFMWGARSRSERDKARRDFRDRKFSILVATTIYDEGVDLPTLDVVVMAGGQMAKGKVFQRLGRGQRTGYYEDGTRKTDGTIVDVFDEGHRLLRKHSVRRLRALRGASVGLPPNYERLLEEEGTIHAQELGRDGTDDPEGRAEGEPGRRQGQEGLPLQGRRRHLQGRGRQGARRGRQGVRRPDPDEDPGLDDDS